MNKAHLYSNNLEDLKNLSLSHGTMRNEDLIPCFLGFIKGFDVAKHNQLLAELGEMALEYELFPLYEHPDIGEFTYNLFDVITEYAPSGYYFGAHQGDGSDYGFWEDEDC